MSGADVRSSPPSPGTGDRNDNAGDITSSDPTYGAVVDSFADHLDTPTRRYVDALGREIAVSADNGSAEHVTRSVLDLADRVIEVWDARGLSTATWTFVYDYAGQRLSAEHSTALGARYALPDAAGNPIWARDARGIETTRTFDALNRPLSEHSDDGSGARLRRAWRYVTYDELDPAFADWQSKNVFGRVEEVRDADGLRFFEYDWRGLVTRASHRFWPQKDSSGKAWNEAGTTFWTDEDAWDPELDDTDRDSITDWLDLPDLADRTTIEVTTTYDAAGRPTEVGYPEGMAVRTTYDAAGHIAAIQVDRDGMGYSDVVTDLRYNARGQLTRLTHGNGVVTTREHDGDLERLVRIYTSHDDGTLTEFQDLSYAYDPVGNPVEITDNLSSSSYKANRIIPNTRTFGYDPRYRLIRATGKKHATITSKSTGFVEPSPDPGDYDPYDYTYAYDEVGNLTRNDEYAATLHYKSGRIDLFNGDSTEAGSFTDPATGNFRYDDNGNTLRTPRLEALAYTHDDQCRWVKLNSGGDAVRYFRHADQRVLRFVKKGRVRALTVYLGPWEYHSRDGGSGGTTYGKLVLHVHGHGRHAQVASGSPFAYARSNPVSRVDRNGLQDPVPLTSSSVQATTPAEAVEYHSEISADPIEYPPSLAALEDLSTVTGAGNPTIADVDIQVSAMGGPDPLKAKVPLEDRKPLVALDGSQGTPVHFSDERRGKGRAGDPLNLHEPWKVTGNCNTSCRPGMRRQGLGVPGGNLATPVPGTVAEAAGGMVSVSPSVNRMMLDRIDQSLAEGRPIVVGVDTKAGFPQGQIDKVSDHFVVIYERGYLDDGTVFYRFVDNAVQASSDASIADFYVHPLDGSICKPATAPPGERTLTVQFPYAELPFG